MSASRALLLAMAALTPPDVTAGPAIPGARLEPLGFAELAGWAADDHAAALVAFRALCNRPAPLRAGTLPPPELAIACQTAQAVPVEAEAARRFFENHFQPWRIRPADGHGFLTGYFEPEYPASLVRSEAFPTPLLGRPETLVTLDADSAARAGLSSLTGARRRADGGLEPFPTRAEIETGAGSGFPVIAWMADAVDRFVMQVQGSGRLVLPDGRTLRVAYAGRNGHPYVSLGRELVRDENIAPSEMTMDRLVARLKGDRVWAESFMRRNPSFVFFRIADELSAADGPIGGAGVPLTPHRSLAVDRTRWAYGLPFWLDGQLPTARRGETTPLARLMIAADTGSAIVGPARFDYFFGAGAEAGLVAGLTRHPVSASVLWPRAAPRLP